MMMSEGAVPLREDFCAFILTHGRPDRVHTFDWLIRSGYSGKLYIVIDDEDQTADEYRARFGDRVLTFSKAEMASRYDEADNFDDRRAIFYARNACWDLAEQVGCRWFIQLDDDYTAGFRLRWNGQGEYGATKAMQIEPILAAMVDFMEASPAITSVALSQGGDHMGGRLGSFPCLTRKAMNSFICTLDRPFRFHGRINEDVSTYTMLGRRGVLFFTVLQAMLNQLQTQSNAGGMTELYLDSGTYVKSFYSVMHSPTCVTIGEIGDPRWPQPLYRIHHHVNWGRCVPKILDARWRKEATSS